MALLVTWAFVVETLDQGFTPLIVRARGGRLSVSRPAVADREAGSLR